MEFKTRLEGLKVLKNWLSAVSSQLSALSYQKIWLELTGDPTTGTVATLLTVHFCCPDKKEQKKIASRERKKNSI